MPDEIQEDIGLMNKTFDEGVAGEVSEPEPDPEPEPEPGPEPEPEPEPDPELEPPEPEPAPEPEPSKEPPEPEPEPEPGPVEDEKDKTIAELRQKLAEKEGEVAPTPPEPEPEPEPEPPLTLDEQDFIGDLDLEELLRDPKEFNKLLNKLHTQMVTTTRKVLGEGVLRSIPDIIRTNVTAMTELQKASDEFYKENEDLRPFKKVVAAVFEEVASEAPGKTYSELLPKVGDEVRNRLELHRKTATETPAAPTPGDEDNPPRLPRKKGRSATPKTKPSTDPLLEELEDMNKSLGGN